jgi:hypothetical protein
MKEALGEVARTYTRIECSYDVVMFACFGGGREMYTADRHVVLLRNLNPFRTYLCVGIGVVYVPVNA